MDTTDNNPLKVKRKYEKIIQEIQLDSHNFIIIKIEEFMNGRKTLNIREYIKSKSFTGYLKKGIIIPYNFVEQFKEGINKIKLEDFQ